MSGDNTQALLEVSSEVTGAPVADRMKRTEVPPPAARVSSTGILRPSLSNDKNGCDIFGTVCRVVCCGPSGYS